MQDLARAALLGVVEGLTEFLPVSSTGHLIVFGHLLHFQNAQAKLFDVVIQLGSISAVIVLYFKRLFSMVTGFAVSQKERRFGTSLLVALVPAVILGLLAHDFIKRVLFSPWVVGVSLIMGGIVMIGIERYLRYRSFDFMQSDNLPLKTSLKIGFCQCLALIPGVSRSGSTIMGGMCFGVSRVAAAEFSFFLAIPTMLGATVLDLWKNRHILSWNGLEIIAVGFIVSFIVALCTCKWIIYFTKKHTFIPFGWYRIFFGFFVLVWTLWF